MAARAARATIPARAASGNFLFLALMVLAALTALAALAALVANSGFGGQ